MPEQNIRLAKVRLQASFPGIRYSTEEKTVPLFFRHSEPFINLIACFTSDRPLQEVKLQLKAIEHEAGRRKEDKEQEIVRLDIDLLLCDGQVCKAEDMKRAYVRRGLQELGINQQYMKYLGIIPARYASTRFPAKPLAMLGGKTVIQRVYEQVAGTLDEVYVATDDERIQEAVLSFGGKVVMTSEHHKSGTDRCYEALTKIGGDFDVVVNIQGDEPFIQPSQIAAVKACFEDEATQIATLVKPFGSDADFQSVENANSPKVVVNKRGQALYFSRSVIPFLRGIEPKDWPKTYPFYKHIGLYAYRVEVLRQITALPQSALEKAESLEQLRWLENGYTIKVGVTGVETIGIDTPQDLAKAEEFLKQQQQLSDK